MASYFSRFTISFFRRNRLKKDTTFFRGFVAIKTILLYIYQALQAVALQAVQTAVAATEEDEEEGQ